jgi:glucose-6-phosphate 1-dehydrogenase
MKKKKSHLQVTAKDKFCIEIKPDECGIVIFGASGDLTHRKLIPSLFNLYADKLLPKGFFILGAARKKQSDEGFRKQALKSLSKIKSSETLKGQFVKKMFYESIDYKDAEGFQNLSKKLTQIRTQEKKGISNTIFYYATPASVYADITQKLADAGLITANKKGDPWTHVIFEKPFGHDLESAKKLNSDISQVLEEHQIYRIDHYLGKETVQNILMLRFANSIFEPIWNRQYIDHVQITAAETLGVEHRAGYYDKSGALRDMFQNHMFQLLSLVAMEPPFALEQDLYRDEKERVARSIRPIWNAELGNFVVRGQYDFGVVSGKEVVGYHQEKDIPNDSQTETFVAMKLFIDNWRWKDVPFYLRSGKRLAAQATEISIHFKPIAHSIFKPIREQDFTPNVLTLRIQPDEGISLGFESKHPGPKLCTATLGLDLDYSAAFDESPPDAYERLLLDCMNSDQSLFVRQDMVERSWGFITKILREWEHGSKNKVLSYKAGSWGPREAHELIEKDGRKWRQF